MKVLGTRIVSSAFALTLFMYAEGFKPSPKRLPCTHKSSDLASTGFDPPCPPLKKGEPDSKSPFFLAQRRASAGI